MPTVGTRKKPNVGNFSKDPMFEYASAFKEVNDIILSESQVNFAVDPVRALTLDSTKTALKEFYMSDSVVGSSDQIGIAEYQDQMDMMNEAFINDIQALQENASVGLSSYNPLIGLSLPMHKYLMMNCVFAQAIPRFVAKSPAWNETMETRYMVTPEGKRIDIANEQNLIFPAWKAINKDIPVDLALPEAATTDILAKYFKVPRTSHNLSVATHISHILVSAYAKAGDEIATISGTTVTSSIAEADGIALVWKPFKAEFNPGIGEANRVIVKPVNIIITEDGTTEKVFSDMIYASQADNMFHIQSNGNIKAVRMMARYDASSRMLKTNKVEWAERSTYVQIPEADGITIPVTPEEVKDIGALYGINQITKYMSMIKDILENVKDDDIKEHLDDSYMRLDDDHRLARTIDFAPPQYYAQSYLSWNRETFMDQLEQFITGLVTILRDPNMKVCVLGRPAVIKRITPLEVSYSAPTNVGPIELNFTKKVVINGKTEVDFISSDKLWGSDQLIVLLIPKNSNRIIYRLYDYQMYISNEIRDNENPALPALSAFQRYKFFEYQALQGRLKIANPSGMREFLPNVDPVDKQYNNNDLEGVFKAYNPDTGKNEPPKNTLS